MGAAKPECLMHGLRKAQWLGCRAPTELRPTPELSSSSQTLQMLVAMQSCVLVRITLRACSADLQCCHTPCGSAYSRALRPYVRSMLTCPVDTSTC